MTWATDRRLDYIDWRLSIHGEIQRADIIGIFGVSEAQASIDIRDFDRAHPGAVAYDKTRKRYVLAGRARRRRGRIYDAAWAAEESADAAGR